MTYKEKVLVIGGGSGIGEAIVEEMRFRTDSENIFVPPKDELDVAVYGQVVAYIAAHGPFDYVVFSAGINYLAPLGDADVLAHADVLDTNLLGFLHVMEALASLQEHHPARVLVIGSDAAERPLRTSISYCASKAGLHMAVRVAARELGPKGWRINAVAPGMTHGTGMQEYVDATVPEVRGWSVEHMLGYEASQEVVPGRITTSEVAEISVTTLFGPDHLNGSIIFLNGGR